MPVCTDLISIGDNTILRKDTILLGYRAQSNYIQIGPVEIGRNAFVGEASVLDIDTAMGDDTQLGHASSLQSGQRMPDGKRYHGSPAVETTADYCPIESTRGQHAAQRVLYSRSSWRRWSWSRCRCRSLAYHFWDQYAAATQALSRRRLDAVAARRLGRAGSSARSSSALAGVYAVPRLCMLFLKPGMTYPLYGFHYLMQSIILRVSNSEFFCLLFGDSSFIVQLHALRRLEPEQGRADRLELRHQPAPRQSVPVRHRHRHDGVGRPVDDQRAHVGSSFRLAESKIGEQQLSRQQHLLSADGRTGANVPARHQGDDPDRRAGARECRPARLARASKSRAWSTATAT